MSTSYVRRNPPARFTWHIVPTYAGYYLCRIGESGAVAGVPFGPFSERQDALDHAGVVTGYHERLQRSRRDVAREVVRSGALGIVAFGMWGVSAFGWPL